jgi:hypothetical protein
MNMTDTIAPKVDQLTADHLIGQSLTIRVTAVKLNGGDQPCDIEYENDGGLPYRPGKSMRRVLVHVWGGDASKYVGRSMRLYREDDVQFGGLKVGGIRISHMSHIDGPVTMALTAKKGSKKAFKVLPLPQEKPAPVAEPVAPAVDKAALATDALLARIAAVHDMDALAAVTGEDTVIKQRDWLKAKRPELAEKVDAAVMAALGTFDPPGDDMPDDSHIATG